MTLAVKPKYKRHDEYQRGSARPLFPLVFTIFSLFEGFFFFGGGVRDASMAVPRLRASDYGSVLFVDFFNINFN